MARAGWYYYDREYSFRLNGFEAVALPPNERKRRLIIFSVYDPTTNLVDREFKTLKEAQAYAEKVLNDEPTRNLTAVK